NGHNFIKETSIQNCEKLLKDFKKNPNIENVSFLYPTKQWEPLFAFLFPKEYKEFLKLIRWIKIPWTPIDTSHFEILETY
ncbi:MAG: hypothetical protein IJY48_06140, partial [Mailhella sp.]|nr:hypothetical protein [Mailhella sp.]